MKKNNEGKKVTKEKKNFNNFTFSILLNQKLQLFIVVYYKHELSKMQKRTNIKCAAHNFYSSRKLYDLKGLLTKNRLEISTKDMHGLERLNTHRHM